MALFGKKKPAEAENEQINETSPINDEMKLILEAREEEREEREAKAREREAQQKEARLAKQEADNKASEAARVVLNDMPDDGFYLLADEISKFEPEEEGNIMVTGNLRGKISCGDEIMVYQEGGRCNKVTVRSIKNDSREKMEQAEDMRVELEVTRGDIPEADSPDGQASRPISRFADLTKGEPKKGRKTPRLLGLMIEYSRFPGDKEFFGSMMDAVINSELVMPIQVMQGEGGKNKINFVGLRNKERDNGMLVPAFTDTDTFNRSLKQGFKVNDKAGKLGVLVLDFARACAIGRTDANDGLVINPFGPVTITLPKALLTDITKSAAFKNTYGEKAADMNIAQALSGEGTPGSTLNVASVPQERRKFIISQPKEEGEFKFIAGAIRHYGDTHADIGKIAVFLSYPEDNPKDRNYVCIVDCPEDKINDIFPDIAKTLKPYMKSVKGVQFQLFSRGRFADGFFKQHPWIYSKLPQ